MLINTKKLSLLSTLLCLTLACCSTASESFDSEATKGVGSKSISEVNAMIDAGKIEGIPGDNDKVIAPVIVQNSVALANPDVLSDHSVIHRQPEQHLRIWIAPFQDANGIFMRLQWCIPCNGRVFGKLALLDRNKNARNKKTNHTFQ